MNVDSAAMGKGSYVAFQDTISGLSEELSSALDYASWLPNEILIYIFSFLAPMDLYWTVRPVCRRWHTLHSIPHLWRWICAEREVPTDILCGWLKNARLLSKLHLRNRNDTDRVAGVVCQHCPKLRSICIVNCAGSEKRRQLKSWSICRLLCKCKYLDHIYIHRVTIKFCRFFKLLAFHRLRSLLTGGKWTYHGPMNLNMLSVIVDDHFIEAEVALKTSNKLSFSLEEFKVRKRDNSLDVQNTINNIWKMLSDEL